MGLISGTHRLQTVLVHVDILVSQQVLAEPQWPDRLTDADRRPRFLFWTHVNPYDRFELYMNSGSTWLPFASGPSRSEVR